MKKLVLCAMAVSLMLLTSCVNFDLGRKIKPSDVIVEKEYAMEAFTSMDVDVVATVKFVQSEAGDYRVSIFVDGNMIGSRTFSFN